MKSITLRPCMHDLKWQLTTSLKNIKRILSGDQKYDRMQMTQEAVYYTQNMSAFFLMWKGVTFRANLQGEESTLDFWRWHTLQKLIFNPLPSSSITIANMACICPIVRLTCGLCGGRGRGGWARVCILNVRSRWNLVIQTIEVTC